MGPGERLGAEAGRAVRVRVGVCMCVRVCVQKGRIPSICDEALRTQARKGRERAPPVPAGPPYDVSPALCGLKEE